MEWVLAILIGGAFYTLIWAHAHEHREKEKSRAAHRRAVSERLKPKE